ncbi:MAG TPA: PASTA domain-containing protein [Gaiellaceae bacterium]|nr:PASTA domain-containing protein [Gaiellaceae bacterium]
MDGERDGFGPATDEVADEPTVPDGEWPVPDQYRVAEAPPEEPAEDVPATGRPRRLPPPLGRRGLATVAGLLGLVLLVPAVAWLATEDGDETPSAAFSPPDTTAAVATQPPTIPPTTTAAPTTEEETTTAEPELVAVPSVVGQRANVAARRLRDAGLVPRILLVPSDRPAGTVVSQDLAEGREVERGAAVRVRVARARPQPAAITVPDVVGLALSQAQSRLREAGLSSTVTREPADEPAGTVLRQAPAAGTRLERGGTVSLRVSSGPAEATVPNVTGRDEASARAELEGAGFVVRLTEQPVTDPAQDGVVLSQDPPGGASAREGSTVTLVVGRLA